MKIAFFHELNDGGARRIVSEYAKRIKKKHTIDLYYVHEQRDREEESQFHRSFFYKFSPLSWSGGNWKVRIYKDTIEPFQLSRLHRKIARDINARKYDLVFVHPSKYTQASFILRYLKTQSVYYAQENLRVVYEPELQNELQWRQKLDVLRKISTRMRLAILKNIDKKNIVHAKRVLVNSKFTKANIRRAYGINSTVCYLGVDHRFFKPVKIKKDIDLIFVGARDWMNGYDLLQKVIKEFKKKPSVHIVDSTEKWISDKELVTLYNRAKLLVSFERNHPFGLIVLEAAACRVPTMAVNEGGYKEIIKDGSTGYLMSRDSKAIAAKIKALLTSPQLLAQLGDQAYEEVLNKWTWEQSTKRLLAIFKQVLHEENKR